MIAAAEVHQLALDQLNKAERDGRTPIRLRVRFDAWLALRSELMLDVSGEPGKWTFVSLPIEVAALPLGMLVELKCE